MKKKLLTAILISAALIAVAYAAVSGGSAGDPLLSLEHLQNVFAPDAERKIDETLDADGEALYGDLAAEWQTAVDAAKQYAGLENAPAFTELRLSRGDVLSGPTGLQVLLLDGAMTVSASVVDVTSGTETASGDALSAYHRYLTPEDTTASFTVVSKTALFTFCGHYALTRSGAPDYDAMADALHALGGAQPLFRGSDYAYGKGYELERAPTRIEALIMLIRLLGEEKQALACTAAHPFTDVPGWCAPYVAYAYQKGYSNGMSDVAFGTSYPASAEMYVEFVLRALGYSTTAHTDISDAPDRALSSGVITAGERDALRTGEFLRADVVYLSYYALDVRVNGKTQKLYERLAQAGILTAKDYRAAQALVTSQRIG